MRYIETLIEKTWFLWIGLSVLTVIWPLLQSGFIITDDGDWMVIRLSAFYQSLAEGQFPVRFLGRLNHGYGYPVANFLYPGFLYFGSLLHISGLSFPDAVKALFIFPMIGSSLFLYRWLRLSFDPISSVGGAISFVFAPYVLYDVYTRGSVGEILAFFPVSVALYAVSGRRLSLLSIAIALLLVSHNSLAALFLFLIVAYAFVLHRRDALYPIVLGIGMATFFWLPALIERRFVQFDAVRIAQSERYILTGWSWELVGLVFVTALGVTAYFWKKSRSPSMNFFLFTFLTCVTLASQIAIPLWKGTAFSTYIQFPYRLLSVSTIAGTWLVSTGIEHLGRYHKLPYIRIGALCVVVFIGFVFQALPKLRRVVFTSRPDTYYTTNEATTTVAGEYLPIWVRIKPIHRSSNRMEIHKGDAKIEVRFASTQRLDASVDAKDTSVVQINMHYYPGWGAMIDGSPVAITYDNEQGVMRIPVEKGVHHLVAEFRETVPRFIADILSAVAVLIYLAWSVRSGKKSVKAYHKR